MNNKWRKWDDRLDLNALFRYFGFEPFRRESGFHSYKMGKDHTLVIQTEKGQRFYKARSPERKLKVFDLVLEQLSKTEGTTKQGLWSKIDAFYGKLEREGLFRLEGSQNGAFEIKGKDYNHFEGMIAAHSLRSHEVSNDHEGQFAGKVFTDTKGRLVFPFHNLANALTGYVIADGNGHSLLGESDLSASVWFSNVPKSIEHLVVLRSPMEALAFHGRFQLRNVVYLAFLDINYDTAKILARIHKTTKLNKMALSLTGRSKVEGYIQDLMLMSFLNDSKFLVRMGKDHLGIRFAPESDKALTNLFNEIKKFNNSLAQDYLGFNKMPDQSLLNQHSIVLTREKDMILCRLPFDVNALRYFLWSYYRNYMGKTIEIIKPVDANWAKELERSGVYGGERAMETFRMAV
ncbi:hypothetical protein ACFSQJ_04145 [Croceitalea marina]|uniref:DUF3991 domain-containing protein n=1 Tax=Croceitalea marina TaxID=1775166 RepID=A0ABW5MSX5_9FLAO